MKRMIDEETHRMRNVLSDDTPWEQEGCSMSCHGSVMPTSNWIENDNSPNLQCFFCLLTVCLDFFSMLLLNILKSFPMFIIISGKK